MKKVLSLVLILAMVLGSFAFTFAGENAEAADFTDYASINYAEAVDVLVATGVINGMPDGTFAPAGNVTRAQMAKMIAVLVNGGEDIGAYYASACTFTDVDGWAKGYVAYCASKGIVDGRDAKTFDPNSNVTAVEAAKMMLVALGYDSKIEGYVGNAWKVNVLKAAKDNDFFDGMDIKDYDLPLNRESAAQVIFNAMQAEVVAYAEKDVITIGDIEISQATKADGEGYDLFTDVFDKELTKPSAKDGDDFGRPAHRWVYKELGSKPADQEIGVYADTADVVFVAEDDFATAEAAIEDYDDELDYANKYTVAVNGDARKVEPEVAAKDVYTGDTVELFYDDEDNIKTVVVAHYELAQIDAVDDDVTAKDAKDDVTCYVDVKGNELSLTGVKDTAFAGFDAKTFVEEAYIAIAMNGNTILDSYVVETVTGELDKVKGGALTIDGTAYDAVGDFWTIDDCDVEDEVEIYLDKNGYALGISAVSSEDEYAYGVLTAAAEDAWEEVQVKIVGTDLAKKTYDVDEEEFAADFDFAGLKDSLVKFTLNDDGEIDYIATTPEKATIAKGKTVSKNGTVAGQKLSKDVVAFWYDTDEKEWTSYDYDDLLEAEFLDAAVYFLDKDDEEVAYILAGAEGIDDGSANDVFAFFKDFDSYKDKDGVKYEITVLANGAEKVYTSVADMAAGCLDYDLDYTSFLKLTLNSDDEVKAVALATTEFAKEPVEKLTKDICVYGADADSIQAAAMQIAKVSGSNVKLGDNDEYVYIGDATIARIVLDKKDAMDDIVKFNGSVKEGGYLILVQTSDDDEVWDTALYMTEADYNALTAK